MCVISHVTIATNHAFLVIAFYSRLSSSRKTLFFSHAATNSMVQELKRIFLVAIIAIVLLLPLAATVPIQAQTQRKAVILSSLEALAPMGIYRTYIVSALTRAGYNVTFLHDTQVTVDFLVTQLNNYNLVIWRTNIFTFNHETYWYVGQRDNAALDQKYSTDMAAGWINVNTGTVGVNTNFFNNHFHSGSLGNVKLALIIASNSDVIGSVLTSAGVTSAIFCNGFISLTFGIMDDLTAQLISYLAGGQDVYDAVFNTVSPYSNQQPRDPLDTNYTPPFWFNGDSTATIS